MNAPLGELRQIAEALGTLAWVQGPGGNLSVKVEGDLWVKASGRRLREIATPDGHTRLALAEGQAALNGDEEADRAIFSRKPRPSLETYFHVLPGRLIAHTHPVGLNLLACSRRPAPDRIAGAPVIDIPYRRPGRPLALVMRAAFSRPGPAVFVLRNHGLVVIADTPDDAIELSREADRHARAIFPSQPPFEEVAARYLGVPSFMLGDRLARQLPESPSARSAERRRFLFPDAVICGKVIHHERATRVVVACSAPELEAATEVAAAHDWIETALEPTAEASYLDAGEPAGLLGMPAEQYRMELLRDGGRAC